MLTVVLSEVALDTEREPRVWQVAAVLCVFVLIKEKSLLLLGAHEPSSRIIPAAKRIIGEFPP